MDLDGGSPNWKPSFSPSFFLAFLNPPRDFSNDSNAQLPLVLRGIFSTYTMDYGGDVLVRHSEGETWALVMKLSKMLGTGSKWWRGNGNLMGTWMGCNMV